MIILGIETSCDETAAAVLEKTGNRIQILSNVIASSASLQAKYGGIIPEQAAREQIKTIIPVIQEALEKAFEVGDEKWDLEVRDFDIKNSRNQNINNHTSHLPPLASKIDAIAVTYGPGLIGSLLVGVETAKTLAIVWGKPLIPINHLLGHFWANWITNQWTMDNGQWTIKNKKQFSIVNSQLSIPKFPCLGLLVSGGHTDLVLFKDEQNYEYLGGTRDDAAGECFDKCARLLGLPYPGGPEISKLASQGQALRFKLPIPMQGHKDFDFSYSGLKTAVANLVHTFEVKKMSYTSKVKCDLAAAIEQTIITSLVDKVILALKNYPVKNVMVAGGVAANQKLTKELGTRCKELGVKLHVPPPYLCTDNGAMIASAAFFGQPIKNPLSLQADPSLSLDI